MSRSMNLARSASGGDGLTFAALRTRATIVVEVVQP